MCSSELLRGLHGPGACFWSPLQAPVMIAKTVDFSFLS